jgi:TonB-dependent SusC/RagA subfamily outer membrane receptor
MSFSTRRVSLIPAVTVSVFAALLSTTGACYHARSMELQPSMVDPSAQRQDLMIGRGPRVFPGVDIVLTKRAGFVVRIHSGLVGDGEPLYVIDGSPMVIAPDRGIDWFKPEDIAQIKVLKYPSELTVYGPRGVNGVIVINTKQRTGR